MQTDADVIISGAGPAGSMAAIHLASLGVSVLILEKSFFPRYKVCGGGLTHKILHEIPFDITPVIETTIRDIRFSTDLKEVYTRKSALPLMYCTMRTRLDSFLLEMALKKGARISTDQQVMRIRQEQSFIELQTKDNTYHSLLVIGADGASGVTARLAGLRDHIQPGLAWEAEVIADTETIQRFSQTVFLDWGTFPGGYGWMFPKNDHFSVGIGGPGSLSKWMIPYYHKFLKYLSSETGQWMVNDGNSMKDMASFITLNGKPATFSIKSWPIPVRVKKSSFHRDRILVTGDAAGLSDPLTGEGIYYAIRSGILAAQACEKFLKGKTVSLQSYTDSVNEELMTELLEANRIKHIFNTVPMKIHNFVRNNDRVWMAFGKILRGERVYTDVYLGFGKWKFLWGMACMVSKWISVWRERKLKWIKLF